jgi:dihydroorotate dehydrogenase (NAD+) catalytic subunit
MKKTLPFYDPKRSYDENYAKGPFGDFVTSPKILPKKSSYEIFGIPIDIPFGIPAGPLLNSNFVKASWNWGYSLATYKTVRGNELLTHPFPNIIKAISKNKNIHPGDTVLGDYNVDLINVETDGITNSFGVPSKTPRIWQADAKKALKSIKKGNTMILSFMGTNLKGMDRHDYIENFAKTCKMARQTGAPILEVNFSCPNFGKEGLVCFDMQASQDILEALSKAKGNTPLLVKIGYFGKEQKDQLNKLLNNIKKYADGVVAINTISANVVNKKGEQALPGSPVRLSSGICGATINWAGLEMAKYIVDYKQTKNWKDFMVIGVGGVTTPKDYFKYMKLGVDAVQSATGAIWNPSLALEIRASA